MTTIGTINEEGVNVDLYIPRKCHASNTLIPAFDFAAIQLNVGEIDANGVYTGNTTTLCIAGFIRAEAESDHSINRLCITHGIIRARTAKPKKQKKRLPARAPATKKGAAPRGARPAAPGARRPAGKPATGDRKPRAAGDRPAGDRPARPAGDRPARPAGDRPARPAGDRPARPAGDRPARPAGDRPARPAGERKPRAAAPQA